MAAAAPVALPVHDAHTRPARTDEAVLCALVAREWRWRGRSVASVALGAGASARVPRTRESVAGLWLDDANAARALRALEERIEQAEEAVRALRAALRAPTLEPVGDASDPRATKLRRLRFAQDSYASALARLRSPGHPDCLRAEARLVEAQIAAWEHHAPTLPDGSPWPDHRAELRVVALRRRWEAVERSHRSSADQRAHAFRELALAASAKPSGVHARRAAA